MNGRSPLAKRAEHDAVDGVEFETLYRSEAPRLLRLFGRKVGPDVAPDLMQESFLRLVKRGRTGAPVISPKGYLTRIALNLIRNPGEIARRERVSHVVPFDETAHAGIDPIAGLEARDMLKRLDRAVASLKPKTRAIFLAHRVEGLNYAQIAERMGMTVKGVEKQMSKALAELDRLIHG